MAEDRQSVAYWRLSPSARYDRLAVSGEVNRMIAAAIGEPEMVLARAGCLTPKRSRNRRDGAEKLAGARLNPLSF